MYNTYPFQLMPLPYKFDALEPEIDAKTVEIHHDKHLRTYVDNLNQILKEYPEYQHWTLEQLVVYTDRLPEKIQTGVKNNAGGVYNHNFYFLLMDPSGSNIPMGSLKLAIERQFESYHQFYKEFTEKAKKVFGSGYAWLVVEPSGKLAIVKTENQDTVLAERMCPIIGIDVWEHAYYLKNQNKRADYMEKWMKLINWDFAEKQYEKCVKF